MAKEFDHGDLTEEEKKAKGIETPEETEERLAKKKTSPKTKKETKKETELKMKTKTRKTKTTKAKTAERAPRAPRIVLSEKQLAEPREAIRVLPAVHKMIERFQKAKKYDTLAEAAEKMIITAAGRLGALERYNSAQE